MKSRMIAGFGVFFLVAIALIHIETGSGPSYAERLHALTEQRDAGLISDEEYWSLRKRIMNVILR